MFLRHCFEDLSFLSHLKLHVTLISLLAGNTLTVPRPLFLTKFCSLFFTESTIITNILGEFSLSECRLKFFISYAFGFQIRSQTFSSKQVVTDSTLFSNLASVLPNCDPAVLPDQWRYCIRIENIGQEEAQLRERHWRIFSLSGTLETVRGRGVVGQVKFALMLSGC